MATKKDAQRILDELKPMLDKFHLTAHVILQEEDEAASEEDENPLAPPKKRPRTKKFSQAKKKAPKGKN